MIAAARIARVGGQVIGFQLAVVAGALAVHLDAAVVEGAAGQPVLVPAAVDAEHRAPQIGVRARRVAVGVPLAARAIDAPPRALPRGGLARGGSGGGHLREDRKSTRLNSS